MTDDRTPQELLADARAVLVDVRDHSSELWHRHEASALIDHIAALEAALRETLGCCGSAFGLLGEASAAKRSLNDELLAVRRFEVLLNNPTAPEADV